MMTMTRITKSTAAPACLMLAFELSERTWKLGFTIGHGQRPRVRSIPAGALGRLTEETERAKARFSVPGDAQVVSCVMRRGAKASGCIATWWRTR